MLQNLLSKLPIPRLAFWLLVSVVLLAGIALISPQQLPVVLYKIALVTIAAVLGYWLDRTLFPYARPHKTFEEATRAGKSRDFDFCVKLGMIAGVLSIRRALIVLACVLGLTLGL
jgi:hypothetical protein